MNEPVHPALTIEDESAFESDPVLALARRWKLLLALPLAVGGVAFGVTFLFEPTFTARTLFLPPQQPQQSAAAAALSSLGGLTALAGGAVRTPADQYAALLQSNTVENRLLDRFDLMKVYDKKLRVEARERLEKNTHITIGRKDGLIAVEVDDHSPQRAADIANRYVEELRSMTSVLVVTEAQQRRHFFESQLQRTREQLVRAQVALQSSGISAGALRAEPRSAAESYARLKAELTASEVRLQTLRGSLADTTPEVQRDLAAVMALRSQLALLAQTSDTSSDANYIGKYREFKYQETLFELFARQYELARVDESREGALIQVIDVASPPERKSWPRRGLTAVIATVGSVVVLLVFLMLRPSWTRGRGGRTTLPA